MGDRPWQQPYELQAYQPTGMIQASSSIHGNMIRKDFVGYDMAELDQSFLLYLNGSDQSSVQEQPQTLNIFPSQPMHEEPFPKGSMTSPAIVAAGSSKRPPPPVSQQHQPPKNRPKPASEEPHDALGKDSAMAAVVKKEASGKRQAPSSSELQEGSRTPDPKTLRRLAQNREAARKSRLRKKAYIQQLETSRIKLSQLEQELQRTRSQGIFLGGAGALLADKSGLLPAAGVGGLSPDAVMFDVEYARWREEHGKLTWHLRAAVEEQRASDVQVCVEAVAAHYGELMGLKAAVAAKDVFHLLSGAWMTPAERCFLWIAGFRPSKLIKIVIRHVEPLSEQQILGLCDVQQSSKAAEDSLEQGLDELHRSISDIISSDALTWPGTFMGHISFAMTKLASLQGFVIQADALRLQTLHKLPEILTIRQSARCFLAVEEYFRRLRALSTLWADRPREEGPTNPTL